MPNKTIYVSDEDLPLYERAQQIAGGNLSAAIARALRRFTEAEEDCRAGYREVTVRAGTGRARRAQRFTGLLLGEWRHPAGERRVERFRVYRTRNGRFALHLARMPDWAAWSGSGAWDAGGWDRDMSGSGDGWPERRHSGWWWGPTEETLDVAGTLEELRDKLPGDFYDTLADEANRPAVEDLDI